VILLNFSHPLTADQSAQVERLAGQALERVVDLAVHFDHAAPFAEQARALADAVPLSAAELQSAAILVNPPALNAIAAALLAELHGRMGYFPPILRLRPVPDSLPPRFEAAEIINLQAIRDAARAARYRA
jgi:hypothetical protein